MTNARMWLVHRPSGKKKLLAKKGAEFWVVMYDVEDALDLLFEDIRHDPNYGGFGDPRQDDFYLDIGG